MHPFFSPRGPRVVGPKASVAEGVKTEEKPAIANALDEQDTQLGEGKQKNADELPKGKRIRRSKGKQGKNKGDANGKRGDSPGGMVVADCAELDRGPAGDMEAYAKEAAQESARGADSGQRHTMLGHDQQATVQPVHHLFVQPSVAQIPKLGKECSPENEDQAAAANAVHSGSLSEPFRADAADIHLGSQCKTKEDRQAKGLPSPDKSRRIEQRGQKQASADLEPCVKRRKKKQAQEETRSRSIAPGVALGSDNNVEAKEEAAQHHNGAKDCKSICLRVAEQLALEASSAAEDIAHMDAGKAVHPFFTKAAAKQDLAGDSGMQQGQSKVLADKRDNRDGQQIWDDAGMQPQVKSRRGSGRKKRRGKATAANDNLEASAAGNCIVANAGEEEAAEQGKELDETMTPVLPAPSPEEQLLLEAKIAAEEVARLNTGKAVHSFFTRSVAKLQDKENKWSRKDAEGQTSTGKAPCTLAERRPEDGNLLESQRTGKRKVTRKRKGTIDRSEVAEASDSMCTSEEDVDGSEKRAKEDPKVVATRLRERLREEARAAAEEIASLNAGKVQHPFFMAPSARVAAQTAEGIVQVTSGCPSSLEPFMPVHVTQHEQDQGPEVSWLQWKFHFKNETTTAYVRPSADASPRLQLLGGCRAQLSAGDPGQPATAEPPPAQIDLDQGVKKPTKSSAGADAMWTTKYQPATSKEVCGNAEAVEAMKSWLTEWQRRSIKKSSGQRPPASKIQGSLPDIDSGVDELPFWDSEDDEDALPTTLLLSGPVGSGKTAAVYACAQELGFDVIESNASDHRSGGHMLQRFREAMQSRGINKWSQEGKTSHQPHSQSMVDAIPLKDTQHRCLQEIDKSDDATTSGVPDVFQKALMEPVRPAPPLVIPDKRTFAYAPRDNFSVAPGAEGLKGLEHDVAKASSSFACGLGRSMYLPAVVTMSKSGGGDNMMLFLFEEVDTLQEEDRGFMAALTQLAAMERRPIILTSNGRQLSFPTAVLAHSIDFHRPSKAELLTHISSIMSVETLFAPPAILSHLITACQHDLRKVLLALQFWTQLATTHPPLPVKPHYICLFHHHDIPVWRLAIPRPAHHWNNKDDIRDAHSPVQTLDSTVLERQKSETTWALDPDRLPQPHHLGWASEAGLLLEQDALHRAFGQLLDVPCPCDFTRAVSKCILSAQEGEAQVEYIAATEMARCVEALQKEEEAARSEAKRAKRMAKAAERKVAKLAKLEQDVAGSADASHIDANVTFRSEEMNVGVPMGNIEMAEGVQLFKDGTQVGGKDSKACNGVQVDGCKKRRQVLLTEDSDEELTNNDRCCGTGGDSLGVLEEQQPPSKADFQNHNGRCMRQAAEVLLPVTSPALSKFSSRDETGQGSGAATSCNQRRVIVGAGLVHLPTQQTQQQPSNVHNEHEPGISTNDCCIADTTPPVTQGIAFQDGPKEPPRSRSHPSLLLAVTDVSEARLLRTGTTDQDGFRSILPDDQAPAQLQTLGATAQQVPGAAQVTSEDIFQSRFYPGNANPCEGGVAHSGASDACEGPSTDAAHKPGLEGRNLPSAVSKSHESMQATASSWPNQMEVVDVSAVQAAWSALRSGSWAEKHPSGQPCNKDGALLDELDELAATMSDSDVLCSPSAIDAGAEHSGYLPDDVSGTKQFNLDDLTFSREAAAHAAAVLSTSAFDACLHRCLHMAPPWLSPLGLLAAANDECAVGIWLSHASAEVPNKHALPVLPGSWSEHIQMRLHNRSLLASCLEHVVPDQMRATSATMHEYTAVLGRMAEVEAARQRQGAINIRSARRFWHYFSSKGWSLRDEHVTGLLEHTCFNSWP